ncbi:hypothetical protein ccbrp13_25140 [Ktedonobacteria bacterium brp13]|nr:hypothetical protein ccbrp13_25140 [Ktedonobacteria bacterium brp13]
MLFCRDEGAGQLPSSRQCTDLDEALDLAERMSDVKYGSVKNPQYLLLIGKLCPQLYEHLKPIGLFLLSTLPAMTTEGSHL